MSACPECGARVPEDARFCPSCAAPVEAGREDRERKLATAVSWHNPFRVELAIARGELAEVERRLSVWTPRGLRDFTVSSRA